MAFLAASRDAHAKLDALNRSQAVIEFNLDGTIITANPNFLVAMGYTLEEIQGKHHGIFVDPDARGSAAYREFWDALRRGEHKPSEFKRVGKGGKPVWIQASYSPLLNRAGKPFKVWFGLRNMGVAPKDVKYPNTGHHHLLIDVELPPMDKEIPNDRNHLHFGAGETETTIELTPGKHTLQLVMGDDQHITFDPSVQSKKITITVK